MDIVFSPSINQSVTYPLAALIEEHHSLFLEVSLKSSPKLLSEEYVGSMRVVSCISVRAIQ